jgi:hypothetical protein
MKTKEFNFEGAGFVNPASSSEPSAGSAGGMEYGGEVFAPSLFASTQGQGIFIKNF